MRIVIRKVRAFDDICDHLYRLCYTQIPLRYATSIKPVKPFIFKRRRNQLKTYIGNEKDIRHSPWRMNLVCQFAAGQTVPEALKQLMFCQKKHAPTVAKVIRRTANLADIRHGFQPSQLEVAECFATHGKHLKRLKIMGRGR